MDSPTTRITSPPARFDRYPGKMVYHLAEDLINRYADDAEHLLDPFCGSGALLIAACKRNIRVTGIDINPFGVLLSRVKVEGFDAAEAKNICDELLGSSLDSSELPVQWDNISYWFTPATLRKFQQLRCAGMALELYETKAGRAVLLALGLSVRACSRADQRSPKPFISRGAREERGRKHFDPRRTMKEVLDELCRRYGRCRDSNASVCHVDVVNVATVRNGGLRCSHVITSPPYLNAQDYFRNSKLELYMIEGLVPFHVKDVVHRFVGTERGLSGSLLDDSESQARRDLVPKLHCLEKRNPHKAKIVHRYIRDMSGALAAIKDVLGPKGTLVIVCGDNLVAGVRIVTWRALSAMVEDMGFTIFDRFEDQIRNRTLAPQRKGHKGLIKQEVISAFRLDSDCSK